MTMQAERRSLHPSSRSAGTTVLLILGVIVGLGAVGLADDSPKPDPAGTATGDKTSAIDAAGNPFVPAEPTDKTAPDYAQRKKEFDDYQAQAAKEPLATKLADDVGHVRVATNFAWTLNTRYLVLFMQAGFALLTCGLVRKKNAAHLMMLNFTAYVFAFLAYYAVGYAFQFGAIAINAAPSNLGGTPTLNHFLVGHGQWGFVGGNIFLVAGGGTLSFYGLMVNLPRWDFGKVLGVYVVFFFVVAQIVAKLRFNQPTTLPALMGGFMIVAGGAVISFWKG